MITPEEVGEENIRLLHAADDAIVYNNIKNSRPQIQDWQKPGIEQWKALHPGEEVPKNWNLSIDGLTQTEDADHSSYMKELAEKTMDAEEDPQKEILYEVLGQMSEQDQQLYQMYYLEGLSQQANIVRFWWDVDRAVKKAVKDREPSVVNGIRFLYQSGMLFIQLPSGRRLAYVKPRMGVNDWGSESVTYEGVGGSKKWERIESYGPKFVENIVQAISRDILCYAMRTLSHCMICAHVHDELIIECREDASPDAICEQMGRTPPWANGLILRADGYETPFYKKD